MPSNAFTIRKLADAAGVSVETVRYYQRRGLLDEPERIDGGFRAYAKTHLDRLQFIRRAQDLGFALDDVDELLRLSSLSDRNRLRVVARERAANIRRRVGQLEAMAAALDDLADRCESLGEGPCPILAALTETEAASSGCHGDAARRSVGATPHNR